MHAQASFEEAVRSRPSDSDARLGAALLELYRNQLTPASANVGAVLKADPANARALALRAAIALRRGKQGEFEARFAGPGGTVIPFDSATPLPTIRVRFGAREAVLAVDTTAPGVLVSPELARDLGISNAGSTIDRLDLGALEIRRVPVVVGAVAGMSGDHDPIEGAIGPLFFSHFLVTIDYARAELVVRPASASGAFERDAAEHHAGVAAMWLTTESDLFTQARVNAAPQALFDLDSRAAPGIAVTPETMQRAHLSYGSGGFAYDAQGRIQRVPFVANVTIGTLTIPKLPGSLAPLGMRGGALPFIVSGSIGAPALAALAITFDFERMELVLERP